MSRKADLINRCFQKTTFQGSDFTRNLQYEGDHVFTRFLTVSGMIEDSWRSDEITQIDNIEVTTLVPKGAANDQDADTDDPQGATTEQLDKTDQTIQVADD